MKTSSRLHFFYAPSKYRKEYKKRGIISFQLQAYYVEHVHAPSGDLAKPTFRYLDKIHFSVDVKTPGRYKFEFEHGKDDCVVSGAKSYPELVKNMQQWGYSEISEKNYLRLRNLVLKLFYRHTNFFSYWWGRNEFYYSHPRSYGYYNVAMVAIHAHHRLEDRTPTTQWMRECKMASKTALVAEEINVFISRRPKKGEQRFQCFRFTVESNRLRNFGNDHPTIEQAVASRIREAPLEQISQSQYLRMRKVLKAMMFEVDQLDLSALRGKQTYFVRELTNS